MQFTWFCRMYQSHIFFFYSMLHFELVIVSLFLKRSRVYKSRDTTMKYVIKSLKHTLWAQANTIRRLRYFFLVSHSFPKPRCQKELRSLLCFVWYFFVFVLHKHFISFECSVDAFNATALCTSMCEFHALLIVLINVNK